MKFFVVLLIFLGFAGLVFMMPQAIASEPQIINENRVRGDAHPDSCTRWQQWEHGYCVDGTDYPAHLDAANFLKIFTVPFIGAAVIFVASTRTPRISKKKRIAIIAPCAILIVFSPSVIFMGGLWFF